MAPPRDLMWQVGLMAPPRDLMWQVGLMAPPRDRMWQVGLMAQKAEEYGSHDKTFEMKAEGTQ